MTDAKNGDSFKTILIPSPGILFKDRKSKFYGYAFPLTSESEIVPFLESLRKKHRNASHVCYAWRLGADEQSYRANDDGEPTHSAGMPIYGQILSFDITGVLVAVVRIYGGNKLGVGGLVNAYRTAARMALEASNIVVKPHFTSYTIDCSYEALNKVLKILSRLDIRIVSQDIQLRCQILVEVRKREEARFSELLGRILDVSMTSKDA